MAVFYAIYIFIYFRIYRALPLQMMLDALALAARFGTYFLDFADVAGNTPLHLRLYSR